MFPQHHRSIAARVARSASIAVQVVRSASVLQPRHMQIFAKMITGRLITLDVESATTVIETKQKIQDKEGIPADQQRLVFGQKPLEDERTLGSYGVRHRDILDLIIFMKPRR